MSKPNHAPPTADMFCYQCEQAKLNKHCTEIGVCGKTPEVQRMQDLLVFALKVITFSLFTKYDITTVIN